MGVPPCGLVVIGGSWGGIAAVGDILGRLPPSFSLPIVVALHRSPSGTDDMLVKALGRSSPLRVVEPDDKAELNPGTVFVAPADYHLLVERDHLALSVDAPVRFSRPSIDVVFESAAAAFGDRLVTVLLTGANDDGARGIAAAKMRGGRTFVQDPSTAERREMPDAAIATGAVDRVLPLPAIAAALAALDPGSSDR
jgi:two-component system, chemotaxis family, protein-glutamate methylesterase/glutaminase